VDQQSYCKARWFQERTRVAASCGKPRRCLSAPSSPDSKGEFIFYQSPNLLKDRWQTSHNFADGDSITPNPFFLNLVFNRQTCCHTLIFVRFKTSSFAAASDVNYLQLSSMPLGVWEPQRTSVCVPSQLGRHYDANKCSVKLTFSFLLSYPLAGLLKRVPDEKPALKNLFIIAQVFRISVDECSY
jgi:hypothetical protein